MLGVVGVGMGWGQGKRICAVDFLFCDHAVLASQWVEFLYVLLWLCWAFESAIHPTRIHQVLKSMDT